MLTEDEKHLRLQKMLQQVGAKPEDFETYQTLESATSNVASNADKSADIPQLIREYQHTKNLENISNSKVHMLESIVMRQYRPVVDIINGKML